jgi:hypothetical protein
MSTSMRHCSCANSSATATPVTSELETVMKPLSWTLLAVAGLGLITMPDPAETWPTKSLRAI